MKNKNLWITGITICLTLSMMFITETKASAGSDPADAPIDWAFEASSVELNDAIIDTYPSYDINEDGFISITEAASATGMMALVDQDISGTIYGIEHFINLNQLIISGNPGITGTIPSGISHLTSLENLDLSRNKLSGGIPAGLSNLSNLKDLKLYNNQLSGAIPLALTNLVNLEFLYLYNNKFSGTIPAELSNLTKLKVLHLHGNQLSGTIPAELGDLSELRYLDLSLNNLTGAIPGNLGELSRLVGLYLSENQLSGTIPLEIANLYSLMSLYLDSNQLSGPIPSVLSDLVDLRELKLVDNQLSGEIPAELGSLSNLVYLELAANELSGSIPAELMNLNNLEYFLLDHNQLISVDRNVYNWILEADIMTVSIMAQNYQRDLAKGQLKLPYSFEALPIFIQLPTYGDGSVIEYILKKPDETTVVIEPVISDGKFKIDEDELIQAGNYTLFAMIEGGLLDESVYQLNFTLEDEIEYISAVANGSANTETSTKIVITLSEDPFSGELVVDNILLSDPDLIKNALTRVSPGVYELEISGVWDEGTELEVTLLRSGTIFKPDTKTSILHREDSVDQINPVDPIDPTDPTAPINPIDPALPDPLPPTGIGNYNIYLGAVILLAGFGLIIYTLLHRRHYLRKKMKG